MVKIWFTILLISVSTIYANENQSFINVLSNAKNTVIFINGKEIGIAPIHQYEVNSNEKILLKAIPDTDYYVKNMQKEVQVQKNKIETINFKFEKAKAKIFLVGADAELYINGTFIKKLHDTNRMVELEADMNVNIKLEDGYARNEYNEDIKANTVTTLKYKLITIPKEVRLYTSSIYELMWEDTKEAANTNVNWEDANRYCKNLKIAHFEDFRLPSLDELEELYENKEEIYNGFDGKFYWSENSFKDDNGIWSYAMGKNFENGTDHRSVKEFSNARVRCVRDIIETNFEVMNEKK